MNNALVHDTMVAAYKGKIARLQAHIAALEAEVARLESRRCMSPVFDQDGNRSGCAEVRTAQRRHEECLVSISRLEAEVAESEHDNALQEEEYRLQVATIMNQGERIAALESDLAALRPCQCNPPGSGEICNGCCKVREILADQVAESGPEAWVDFCEAFDAAVQAVRL